MAWTTVWTLRTAEPIAVTARHRMSSQGIHAYGPWLIIGHWPPIPPTDTVLAAATSPTDRAARLAWIDDGISDYLQSLREGYQTDYLALHVTAGEQSAWLIKLWVPLVFSHLALIPLLVAAFRASATWRASKP
jgi:hypothetical protein